MRKRTNNEHEQINERRATSNKTAKRNIENREQDVRKNQTKAARKAKEAKKT